MDSIDLRLGDYYYCRKMNDYLREVKFRIGNTWQKDNSIFLRSLQIKDALTSYKWRNNPEVWKHTQNKPDKFITQDMETSWIKGVLKRKNEKRFAICYQGRYIGNIHLSNIHHTRESSAQVHIFIGEPECWGKGIGTTAINLIADYAFKKLKFCILYAAIDRKNAASLKAFEKAKFIYLFDMGNERHLMRVR